MGAPKLPRGGRFFRGNVDEILQTGDAVRLDQTDRALDRARDQMDIAHPNWMDDADVNDALDYLSAGRLAPSWSELTPRGQALTEQRALRGFADELQRSTAETMQSFRDFSAEETPFRYGGPAGAAALGTAAALGLSADAEASVLSSLRDDGLETAPWSEMGGQEQPGWNETAADWMRQGSGVLPFPFNLSVAASADFVDDPIDAAAEYAVGSTVRQSADNRRQGGWYDDGMGQQFYVEGDPDFRAGFFEEDDNLYQQRIMEDGQRGPGDMAWDRLLAPTELFGGDEIAAPFKAGRGALRALRGASFDMPGGLPRDLLPGEPSPMPPRQPGMAGERISEPSPMPHPATDAARYVDEFQLDNADLWRGDGGADPSVRDLPSAPPPPIEGAESSHARRRAARAETAIPWPSQDTIPTVRISTQNPPPRDNLAGARQDQLLDKANLRALLEPTEGSPHPSAFDYDAMVANVLQSVEDGYASHIKPTTGYGPDFSFTLQGGVSDAARRMSPLGTGIEEVVRATPSERFAQRGIDRWRADRTAARAEADAARDASMRETVNDMAYPPVDNAGIHAAGAAGLGGTGLWLYGALTAPQEEESIRAAIPDFDPADPAVDLETYRDTPFYRDVEALPPYGGADAAVPVHTPFETPDNVFPLQWNGREWESIPRGDAPYAEAGEGQVSTVGPEGLPDAPSHDRGLWGASGETPPVAPDPRFFPPVEIDDPNEIRDLQTRLLEAGFDPGTIDGIVGENTRGAISGLAGAYGVPPPEDLTAAYQMALGARQKPVSVRDIQEILSREPGLAAHMAPYGADDDYGPLTEESIELAFPGYDAPPNAQQPTPEDLLDLWRRRLTRSRYGLAPQ
jgi:hypothetical protein